MILFPAVRIHVTSWFCNHPEVSHVLFPCTIPASWPSLCVSFTRCWCRSETTKWFDFPPAVWGHLIVCCLFHPSCCFDTALTSSGCPRPLVASVCVLLLLLRDSSGVNTWSSRVCLCVSSLNNAELGLSDVSLDLSLIFLSFYPSAAKLAHIHQQTGSLALVVLLVSQCRRFRTV